MYVAVQGGQWPWRREKELMKEVGAEVIAADSAWAGARRLALRAPGIVREAAPGQFIIVACADDPLGGTPLLRRALWIAGMSQAAGDLVALYTVVGRGTRWLASRGQGDIVRVLGPIGRPLSVDDKTRRVLLVGRGVAGLAPLLGLAADLAGRGLAVTLLADAPTAADLPPAALLHHEVEYLVATADGSAGKAGSVLDLAPDYLSWADQVCAALPLADYEPLLALVRKGTLRPRPTFVQALYSGQVAVPCATGACDGCTVRTRDGYRRLCRDGAVFALPKLVG